MMSEYIIDHWQKKKYKDYLVLDHTTYPEETDYNVCWRIRTSVSPHAIAGRLRFRRISPVVLHGISLTLPGWSRRPQAEAFGSGQRITTPLANLLITCYKRRLSNLTLTICLEHIITSKSTNSSSQRTHRTIILNFIPTKLIIQHIMQRFKKR